MTGIILASCGNFSEISVGEVRDLKIKGIEDNALLVSISLPVENPTLHKITITDLDSKVYVNNQYLGIILMDDKLILPSRSQELYHVDLKIRLANLFGAALSMMNLRRGQRIIFRLEGELKARSALVKRKIPIKETRQVVI